MKKDNNVRKVVEVVDVFDGDTFTCYVQNNRNKDFYVIRMNAINTPEKNSKDSNVKKKAMEATEFTRKEITTKPVHIEFIEDEYYRVMGFAKGGFGRELAIVWVGEGEEQYNLNEKLMELGLAKVYK